jgi:type I restriction enzyme M protein
VLGLIFLRHASSRFGAAKAIIEEGLPVPPTRGRREITKDDFVAAKAIYLPTNAQWQSLMNLPEGDDLGEQLNEAMRAVEAEHNTLSGVLPKDYHLFDKELLHRLLRVFNDESLDSVTGDVFGRIYEYFLNKFAMTGAQEGGEFFTPPSLVNTIINVIEPKEGVIFDPAVGSAGMFVQTAHFMQQMGTNTVGNVTFYGQEKANLNTRLAKMNMAVHALEAKIAQCNTFYEDRFELMGKCDFVMANPPFNVDSVDKTKEVVKNDLRLPFGLPSNDNANYLWVQYFYSYLNQNGRAGFVMASSASDAGNKSEQAIRQKLVNTGAVDVMISIGTKFFYTRALPCTLWFLDRAKERNETRADQTLMLDYRQTFRKVSTNLHDFTPEQLRHTHAIVAMYRGNNQPLADALAHYQTQVSNHLRLANECQALALEYEHFDYQPQAQPLNLANAVAEAKLLNKALDTYRATSKENLKAASLKAAATAKYEAESQAENEAPEQGDQKTKKPTKAQRIAALKKDIKQGLLQALEELEKLVADCAMAADQAQYFNGQIEWLNTHFPEGKYADVPGLCKIVSRAEIIDNDYSLTPGRYVGLAPTQEQGFDYEARMKEIKEELRILTTESAGLAEQIDKDLSELGL